MVEVSRGKSSRSLLRHKLLWWGGALLLSLLSCDARRTGPTTDDTAGDDTDDTDDDDRADDDRADDDRADDDRADDDGADDDGADDDGADDQGGNGGSPGSDEDDDNGGGSSDADEPDCNRGTAGCGCSGRDTCDPGLRCEGEVCVPEGECTSGAAGCACFADGTCDDGLSCRDELCVVAGGDACEPSASVSGTLSVGATEISFDTVRAELAHKRDVDVSEDGCIRRVELAFQSGEGCLLSVAAAERVNAQNELLVSDIAFSADSQCPNFLDADEGLYAGSGDAILGSRVSLKPSLVPERNVALACFEATFQVLLEGTIETGDGRELALQGTALEVSGVVVSAASEGSCPVECERDADCAGDLRCVDHHCANICDADQQCGAGSICQSGACTSGCRLDSDCAEGEACQADTCVVRAEPECSVHDDCNPDEICDSGRCVPGSAPECSVDADCDGDEVCEAGSCVVQVCSSNNDCDSDQVCDAERCRLGCRSDSGCPAAGEICTAGDCVPGCRNDGDCGVAGRCQDGSCVGSGDPGADYGACGGDLSCSPGLSCFAPAGEGLGVCVRPCEATSECPDPPTTGTSLLQCLGDCLLRCDDLGYTCPDGMTCGSYQICLWDL